VEALGAYHQSRAPDRDLEVEINMEGTMNQEAMAVLPKPKRQRKPPASTTPADLLRMAIERGVDVSSLEKLMDMNFRFEAAQAKRQSDEAMCGFKAEESLKIIKSRTVKVEGKNGGGYEYKFPPLAECCEIIVPLLSKHCISHRWDVQQTEVMISVTCILTHVSGHVEECTISGPPDLTGGKNQVQAIASTISYLERYTLLAVTGLAASDMPQGERDEILAHNPFANLSGKEFEEAFKQAWQEAPTKAAKHVLLDFKSARQKELVG
jgi:hypothetical protein